uniref:Uncharacterized protein n=1 Tax=Craspedostauros australis TaxID=1486917 RepID=A0A6T6H830_9STRA|mmetsp:Transcript_4792/g.12575  ORF Transcript_4792/g.12575 Transcript_4792/m.12575 type:complete len:377 (+) Transcript_4792:285-1415(+)|eukprot:CAMPEP_0198119092 /NCGR_PEP_ID=MMETSP1442-20131203/24280_1 /TAXON_ID= /ORGANISM="Craspedostauros australis, Strain CCMP3328" /LENGTH=376 /DNA_ID=CAMNT_0043777485 /DNA_START=270 /DNA_END=1400 /DNA_ORIENTATION=-
MPSKRNNRRQQGRRQRSTGSSDEDNNQQPQPQSQHSHQRQQQRHRQQPDTNAANANANRTTSADHEMREAKDNASFILGLVQQDSTLNAQSQRTLRSTETDSQTNMDDNTEATPLPDRKVRPGTDDSLDMQPPENLRQTSELSKSGYTNAAAAAAIAQNHDTFDDEALPQPSGDGNRRPKPRVGAFSVTGRNRATSNRDIDDDDTNYFDEDGNNRALQPIAVAEATTAPSTYEMEGRIRKKILQETVSASEVIVTPDQMGDAANDAGNDEENARVAEMLNKAKDEALQRERRLKRWILILIVVCVVVASIVIGVTVWAVRQDEKPSDDNPPPRDSNDTSSKGGKGGRRDRRSVRGLRSHHHSNIHDAFSKQDLYNF